MYIDVVFELHDDFIYHLNERRRLCIFVFYEQKIFRMIHDENQHFERHRCYQRISNFVYVSRLFKKFRFYIEHCLDCQLNQIKRHRLYEKMIFIFNTFKSFHTLIMNFIVDLSNEFDVLLTITNKFFRRVMFIYDKSTYIIAK